MPAPGLAHRTFRNPPVPLMTDDRSLLRPEHQGNLKMSILLVVEMATNRGREDRRFNEPHEP